MPHLSPPTLTQSEQQAILRATTRNPRDHLIYSLALGTGLRLAEIVDIGDVYIDDRTPRTRLRIRPEIAKGGRRGDVFLPDALMGKLRRFWTHKALRWEGLQPQDPLFCSQSRVRISKRRVQFAFRTWQVKAGFDRLYPFHALRHYAELGITAIPP
ncbi:MAG: site-specific integrase [Acidobacteria bacterium]|nr:site-specific integrase [Acidobacteriota bacterium]